MCKTSYAMKDWKCLDRPELNSYPGTEELVLAGLVEEEEGVPLGEGLLDRILRRLPFLTVDTGVLRRFPFTDEF